MDRQGLQEFTPLVDSRSTGGASGRVNQLLSGHIRGLPPDVVNNAPIPRVPGLGSSGGGTATDAAAARRASQHSSVPTASANPSVYVGGFSGGAPAPRVTSSAGGFSSGGAAPMPVPGVNAELLQLISRFAPLELNLAHRPVQPTAASAVMSTQPSLQELRDASQARITAASAAARQARASSGGASKPSVPATGARRHTVGGVESASAPSSKRLHSATDGGTLQGHVGQDGVYAAAALRGNVKRDPKLLPNPVEDERLRAQQRQAAAHAMAERERELAKQRRKTDDVQQKQKAERLAAETENQSKVAKEAAASAATVADPPPAAIMQPLKPKLKQNTSGDVSSAAARPTAAEPATVAEHIQAELEAADQEGTDRGAKQGRGYEKPWQRNMRKPGTGPAPLQPEQGAGGEGLPRALPDVDVVMEEGPPGPAAVRNVSPGPVRAGEIDAAARQRLKEFMERRRVEIEAKMQQDKVAAEAARTQALDWRRQESARARMEARRRAEEGAIKPAARARKPWMDLDINGIDSDDDVPAARAKSTGRARHGPDFDAVSLRNQPNTTTRALQREAQGARMRITAAHGLARARSAPRGGADRAWENEDPDDVAVVRVRDPSKRIGSAPARPKTAAALQKAPLQERGNIMVRAVSPLRLGDPRYVDSATRRAAAADYAERVRQQTLAQLKSRQREIKLQLRRMRQQRKAAQLMNNAAATSTAALAQRLFPGANKKRPARAALPQVDGPDLSEAMPEPPQQQAPSSQEVAMLRQIALQLKQRIEQLHEEAQQARTAQLPYAPVVAWGEPVTGPTGAALVMQPLPPQPQVEAGYRGHQSVGTQMSLGGAAPQATQRPADLSMSSDEEEESEEDIEMQLELLRRQRAQSGAGADSADGGSYQKRPRLSMEDGEQVPPRPSIVPAIRIPTAPRRSMSIPDPTAPYDANNDGVDLTGGMDQRGVDRLQRYSSGSSSSSSVDRPVVQRFEDLQAMLADADMAAVGEDAEAAEAAEAERRRQEEYEEQMYQQALRAQQESSASDHSPAQPAPRAASRHSQRAAQAAVPMLSSFANAVAEMPVPAWAAAGADTRASLPLRLPDAPPSPGSDLLGGYFTFDSPSKRVDCEEVVQQYEQRGGSPLRIRPAKKALMEGSSYGQRKPGPSLLLAAPFGAKQVEAQPGSMLAPPQIRPAKAGSSMSIINIITQRTLAPKQPVIQLPLPPAQAQLQDAASQAAFVSQFPMFTAPQQAQGARPAAPIFTMPDSTQRLLHVPPFGSVQPTFDALPPYLVAPSQPTAAGYATFQPQTQQQYSSEPAFMAGPASAPGYATAAHDDELPPPPAARELPFLAETIPSMATGNQKPRLSPAELQRELLESLRKYEEVENLERELSQIEQARAVAAVQQEAHRIASTLDQTLALQQTQSAAHATAQQQEQKLQVLADSIRREVRTESLKQLKDVASMFVQHFKANRIAHAEVQTFAPEPKPPPPQSAHAEFSAQVDLIPPAPAVPAPAPAAVARTTRGSTIQASSVTGYSDDFHSVGQEEPAAQQGASTVSIEVEEAYTEDLEEEEMEVEVEEQGVLESSFGVAASEGVPSEGPASRRTAATSVRSAATGSIQEESLDAVGAEPHTNSIRSSLTLSVRQGRGEPATPHAGRGTGLASAQLPRTPLSDVRASAAGVLGYSEEEVLNMLRNTEASAQEELDRLQGKLDAVTSAGEQRLQQIARRTAVEREAGSLRALMREEFVVKSQMDMDASSIQKQMLAIKEDLAMKRVQVYQLHRLLEQLTGSAGTTPSLILPTATVAAATPTRSARPAAPLPAARPTTSTVYSDEGIAEDVHASGTAAESMDDVYTEDFDTATERGSTRSRLPSLAKIQQQRATQQTASVISDVPEDQSVSQPTADVSLSADIASERMPHSSASGTSSIPSEDHVRAAPAPAHPAASRAQPPAARHVAAVQRRDGDDAMSDISARSAELEAQREQVAAQLKAKQQELQAQQRKQQLDAKQQELAAMQKQLAALDHQIVVLKQAPKAPAAARAPTAPSASDTYAQEFSDEVVSEERARSGSGLTQSVMETEASSIPDDATGTISDEAMSVPASSAVSSVPESGVQAPRQRVQQVQARFAPAPAVQAAAGRDSLELQEQEIKRLQDELDNKKREAQRIQLQAERMRLQRELQAADQQIAASQAAMWSGANAPLPAAPSAAHKPPVHPGMPTGAPRQVAVAALQARTDASDSIAASVAYSEDFEASQAQSGSVPEESGDRSGMTTSGQQTSSITDEHVSRQTRSSPSRSDVYTEPDDDVGPTGLAAIRDACELEDEVASMEYEPDHESIQSEHEEEEEEEEEEEGMAYELDVPHSEASEAASAEIEYSQSQSSKHTEHPDEEVQSAEIEYSQASGSRSGEEVRSAQHEYSQASGSTADEVESAEVEHSQASALSVAREGADEAESAEIEYSQDSSVKTASVATSSGASRAGAVLLDVEELNSYAEDEVEGPAPATAAAASTSIVSDVPAAHSRVSEAGSSQRSMRRTSSGGAGRFTGSAIVAGPDEVSVSRSRDGTRSLSTSFHAIEGPLSTSAALVQDLLTGETVQDASALFEEAVIEEVATQQHEEEEEEEDVYSEDFDEFREAAAVVSTLLPAAPLPAATAAAAPVAAASMAAVSMVEEDVQEEEALSEVEEELEVDAPSGSKTYSDDFAANSMLSQAPTITAAQAPATAIAQQQAPAVAREAPVALAAVRRLASDNERGESLLDASDLLESMMADDEEQPQTAAAAAIPEPSTQPTAATVSTRAPVPAHARDPSTSYTMDFSGVIPGAGVSDGLRSNSMDEAEAAAAPAALAPARVPADPATSVPAAVAPGPAQQQPASHQLDDDEAASVEEESIHAASSVEEEDAAAAPAAAQPLPSPTPVQPPTALETPAAPAAPAAKPVEHVQPLPVQELSVSVEGSQSSAELQGPESSEEQVAHVADAETSDELADIHHAFVQQTVFDADDASVEVSDMQASHLSELEELAQYQVVVDAEEDEVTSAARPASAPAVQQPTVQPTTQPAPAHEESSASEIVEEEELEVGAASEGEEEGLPHHLRPQPGAAAQATSAAAEPSAEKAAGLAPAPGRLVSAAAQDLLAAMPSELHAAPESASDELMTYLQRSAGSEPGKGSFELEMQQLLEKGRAPAAAAAAAAAAAVTPDSASTAAAAGMEPAAGVAVAGTARVPPPLAKEQSERSSLIEMDEYSMSFDGLEGDLEVDASSPTTAGPRQMVSEEPGPLSASLSPSVGSSPATSASASASSASPGASTAAVSPPKSPLPKSPLLRREAVEQYASSTLTSLLRESVEVMVGVAGGPGELSSTAAVAGSSKGQEDEEEEKDDWATSTIRRRGPAKQSADASGDTISEEDLGWGNEDELGDYELDLGSYVVPEHDQAIMRKEAEAAAAAAEAEAAPSVILTPASVEEYVSRVMEALLQEGPLPQVLRPGQEPLTLEGFLNLERALPDASDAQHIANKLLYDAANEALINCYRAANRISVPSWMRRPGVVRPLPAQEALVAEVKKQVLAWCTVKVRGEAELEKLLSADAAEDDRTWAALEEEETAGVKLEVSEMLWMDLLTDTAQVLADLDERRGRRGSTGGGSSGQSSGGGSSGVRTRLPV